MKYIFQLSTILLFFPVLFSQGKSPVTKFDKSAVYAAMASTDVETVDRILFELKISSIPEKAAYEGALLMKKAGLMTKAKEKLSFFKSGRTKLEGAIKTDEGNIEYHFLRLVIQENAPKIVKYKGNLENDRDLLRSSFKKLDPVVQQAVKDYSKKSKYLKPGDF
ncbi:MAG: hypothetical protein ABIN01_01580 [Ferruginibacter sp.]